MRKILFPGLPIILAGIVLSAATVATWQHRFAPIEGNCLYRLAQLLEASPHVSKSGESSALRLERQFQNSPTFIDLPIPDALPVRHLHTSVTLRAEALVAGEEIWENGRLTIEWLHPDGSVESDHLASLRDSEERSSPSVVSHPKNGAAIPVLRLVNHGRSGSVILEELELFTVTETLVWKSGKWLLAVLWLLWAAHLAGAFQAKSWKPWLAAGLWLLIGTQIVFPGPWHNDRPLGQSFSLTDPAPATPSDSITTQIHSSPLPAPSVGKPKSQGTLLLQIKQMFGQLRPLLHFGLFCLPTLAFLLLIPLFRALALTASLAIGAETAQWGFGFGFAGEDVVDLLNNGLGALAAIGIYEFLKRHPRIRRLGRPS